VGATIETSTYATADVDAGCPSSRRIAPANLREVRDRAPAELHEWLVDQRHDEYTAAEHAVWRALVRKNRAAFGEFAHRLFPAYLDGLARLDLDPERIPTIESINRQLAPIGWVAACVDGYIPASAYSGLLASRIFPVSRQIRSERDAEYSPTPDLVHDIFGHLPILFHRPHRKYLESLAAAMHVAEASENDHRLFLANHRLGELKCASVASADQIAEAEAEVDRVQNALRACPSELTELSRLFLWSIEFSLIGKDGDYQILGAGLLSSIRESVALYEPGTTIHPYSMNVIRSDIHFSDLQSQYFAFADYETPSRVLAEYRARRLLQ
jgi:phenylalanine-4-hydroxylase